MTPKIRTAEYVERYRIRIVFEDGAEGEVDLESELWGEVFEPLKDFDLFKTFFVHKELNTLCWPTGADLAPEFLYEQAVQKSVTAAKDLAGDWVGE